MNPIAYDPSRASLFHPGGASQFLPREAITNELVLCAEMARLAYVQTLERLSGCLAAIDFELTHSHGFGVGGTQVFAARRRDQALTVIAFRGTEPDDPSDLFTDADFDFEPWMDADGEVIGQVHDGFSKAIRKDGLLESLRDWARAQPPGARLLLTGHSLGAALASLLATQVEGAELLTFGSPRVGDDDFASALQRVAHRRVVDCCDLVTRVPPAELGYAHAGSLVYIDRHGRLQQAPADDAIDSDRRLAHVAYLARYAFLPGTVFSRDLADHAPVNYVSGVMGARISD